MARGRWWAGALLLGGITAGWVLHRASEGEVRGPGAVQELYDRVAPAYDVAALMFNPLGERRMRHRAVDLLDLHPGDTVVDLGCGTGINQPLLSTAVGPRGHVVGIDLSPGMLQRAQARVDRLGLSQVTLEHGDLREVTIPAGTAGVLATFSLEMVPEHDAVVRDLAAQLAPTGGMLAVLGVRRPPSWPDWAVAAGRYATAGFGVTRSYEEIQPWRSVRTHMDQVAFETAAAGALYLIVARAVAGHPASRPRL